MKLADDNLSLKTDNIQQEHVFGISDMGLVFDILRNKMYSDRIMAICREITCNARDAHREAGKGSVPIKIILPSDLDEHYRVIDKGVGISPERMANIFVKYAASTKRDSNLETGGFGLGAKTPFSYADSFMIETIFDGFKYLWSAVIDETKVGKVLLMDKIATEEPNGTEIRIPVYQKDYHAFAERTEKSTRWWDVLPEVVGMYYKNNRPSRDNAIMTGTDWEMHKTNDHYVDRLTVVVDGIQYDVDDGIASMTRGHVVKHPGVNMILNGSKHTVIFFDNGTLKMNANREQVSWDDATKQKVVDRLLIIADEVFGKVSKEIETCKTYRAACKRANEFSKAFNMSGLLDGSHSVRWNGLQIQSHFGSRYSEGAWTDYSVKPNTMTFAVPQANSHSNVGRTKSSGYDVSGDGIIVVNDVGIQNLSVKRAAQIFDLLPEATRFTVVPQKTWDSDDVFKKYQAHIPHLMLSSVTGTLADKKPRKPRRTIFVYTPSPSCGSGKMERSSVDFWDNETKKRIFVLSSKAHDNSNNPYLAGIRNVEDVLRYVAKNFDVQIFAFDKALFDEDPESFEAFTDEAEPALDFIKREVFSTMDHKTLYEASEIDSSSDHVRFGETLGKIAAKVKDRSLFDAYETMCKHLKNKSEIFATFSALLRIVYSEDVQKWDNQKANKEIKTAYEKIVNRYPMLPLCLKASTYYYNGQEKTLAEYCDQCEELLDLNTAKLANVLKIAKIA